MTPTERMLTDQLLASRAEVDRERAESMLLLAEVRRLRAAFGKIRSDTFGTKMHRRAQCAESDVALMNRQARRWKHAYERMVNIVCDAWDALPVHIREEITVVRYTRDNSVAYERPRDLVRGVRMLAEETRTCDCCGAVGELDARCGRCLR